MQFVPDSVLLWSLALVIGFPCLVILLGEAIQRQSRRRPELTKTLEIFRNIVLPILAGLLFTEHVLRWNPDDRHFKILATLFWIAILHGSLSLLNALLFEKASENTWRSRVPKLLIDLSRLVLIVVGAAFVSAVVWNADLAGVATALGVSSIVLGLALQDTLGSIMSGIALLFERPFAVGNWLRVGDVVGQVLDMNWRSVRLLTLEGHLIVIPHRLISNEVIRNYSQPQELHAERIQIGFSYNDPPNQVIQALQELAISTPGILSHPAPQVFTLQYADSAITYEIKFYIADYGAVESIRSQLMTRLWYIAQRNQFSIPFPIRTLYHYHGPTTTQQADRRKLDDRLQKIPPYIPLERPATGLEAGIRLQHFGRGERVIVQGKMSDHLYIIVSGQSCMTYTDGQGQEHEVMLLHPGDFFGVMALFSDEMSPVTIAALSDLEVMALTLAMVNQMIDRQPSFAREIAQVQDIQQRALDAMRRER
ncbi:mechanosensitive ion channel family protein [Alkalinema sp. FACHB-956]|uniref:mechanosensitive ion channel family protein n=1 Tax=Alkalinema sp. FACHB-956 TaxID=2692768 RepID=UPI001688EE96|nr:mechanosensitive ion channel family protein [Alkalinema sp. FACHB-956]MBD2329363.1 mechanosensitive ion channel [Alkalinema sp. FACHB-956]